MALLALAGQRARRAGLRLQGVQHSGRVEVGVRTGEVVKIGVRNGSAD